VSHALIECFGRVRRTPTVKAGPHFTVDAFRAVLTEVGLCEAIIQWMAQFLRSFAMSRSIRPISAVEITVGAPKSGTVTNDCKQSLDTTEDDQLIALLKDAEMESVDDLCQD
jgi:hypothetical protein